MRQAQPIAVKQRKREPLPIEIRKERLAAQPKLPAEIEILYAWQAAVAPVQTLVVHPGAVYFQKRWG